MDDRVKGAREAPGALVGPDLDKANAILAIVCAERNAGRMKPEPSLADARSFCLSRGEKIDSKTLVAIANGLRDVRRDDYTEKDTE